MFRKPTIVRDERGVAAIEYGLILGLIALAVIGGLTVLAGGVGTLWAGIVQGVQDSM